MNVLLIDIPSYKKEVDQDYRDFLEIRIKAEAIIEQNKMGFVHRGELPCSRGLLQIGSALKKFEHQVSMISIFDSGFWGRISALVREAEVVGITCMTPSYNIMKEICNRVKSINPRVIIVAGGHHVTYLPVQTLVDIPAIDIVIRWEGELAFVNSLKNYPDLTMVDNIVYRHNEEIITNNSASRKSQLSADDFVPAFDLLEQPLDQYSHNILTQKGCKYNCDYCVDANVLFRYSNPSLAIAELCYLEERLPANSLIYFSDDVISSNKKRLLELCDLIAKEVSQLYFVCELRAEDVDKDIVDALVSARFVQFNLGLEHANDENLLAVNRTVTAQTCIRAFELIRKCTNGLIGTHWLTGIPNATKKTTENGIKLINDLLVRYGLVDIISNKIFVPYPGTKIYEQPNHYGVFIDETDWSCFDRLSRPVYHTSQLSSEEIWNLFLEVEKVIIHSYAKVLGLSLTQIQESDNNPIHSYNKFSYLDGF